MGTGALIGNLLANRRPLRRFLTMFAILFSLYMVGIYIAFFEDIKSMSAVGKAETVSTVAYFGLLLGWALAYASAYQLPENIWILGVGLLFSSMLFTYVMFISSDSYLHAEGFSAKNIATVVFITAPTLSFVILGLSVLVLQFFKFALKRIFWAEIKKYKEAD